MKKERTVYIVLSQTDTLFARLIRLYTREPYVHASLAFDEELEEMYSFARRGLYNPLNAGFVQEHLDRGIFGKNKKTRCCIYELDITSEQYERLRVQVDYFKQHEGLSTYNFFGVVGVVFRIPIEPSEFTCFCTQFVAEVLKRSEIYIMDRSRSSALVSAVDFRTNPHLRSIYTGLLAEYRHLKHSIPVELLP